MKLLNYTITFLTIVAFIFAILGKLFGGFKFDKRRKRMISELYIANPKLCDFSAPKDVYNFRVPTSTPDLSKLREPARVDLNKAIELFIPPVQGLSVQSRSKEMERMPSSKESSASRSDVEEESQGDRIEGERSVAADSSSTSQPAASIPKPNWELARKLFVVGWKGGK